MADRSLNAPESKSWWPGAATSARLCLPYPFCTVTSSETPGEYPGSTPVVQVPQPVDSRCASKTKSSPGRKFGLSFPVLITIELPDLASQTRFNLARWSEILADPELAKLPYRIETDQHGNLVMSPPPAPLHGQRQVDVALLLRQLLPKGRTLSECPVSTAAGVKAIDVAWLAPERTENIPRLALFERAPDICVETPFPFQFCRRDRPETRSLFRRRRRRGLDLQLRRIDVLFCRSSSSANFYFRALSGVPRPDSLNILHF
jgi:hypothetical protein